VATGTATIKLQTFSGDLKPDLVTAAWSGGGFFARVGLPNLTYGTNIDVGSVTTLEATGADLSDVTFAAAGTGWEDSELELGNADDNKTVWRVFGKGPTITSRGLPHLPSTVALADLDSASPV